MTIQYIPNEKIIIAGIELPFNTPRSSIRALLSSEYKEDDRFIPLGSDTKPIHQIRDIYKNIKNSQNFFFLCYDEKYLLNEVEIHYCEKLEILDTTCNFKEELIEIVEKIAAYDPPTRLDEGEFFFKELKMVLSDNLHMGGDATTLSYFYCSIDVSHIEKV